MKYNNIFRIMKITHNDKIETKLSEIYNEIYNHATNNLLNNSNNNEYKKRNLFSSIIMLSCIISLFDKIIKKQLLTYPIVFFSLLIEMINKFCILNNIRSEIFKYEYNFVYNFYSISNIIVILLICTNIFMNGFNICWLIIIFTYITNTFYFINMKNKLKYYIINSYSKNRNYSNEYIDEYKLCKKYIINYY